MKRMYRVLALAVGILACGSLSAVAAERQPLSTGSETTTRLAASESVPLPQVLDALQKAQASYMCPEESQCSTVADCFWLVCPPGREVACRPVCGRGICECQWVVWPD